MKDFQNIINVRPLSLRAQSEVEELLKKMDKKPDYSSPSRRKRFVDDTFRKCRNGFERIGRHAAWVAEGRRKKAVLEAMDQAVEISKGMGLDSPEETFVLFEGMSFLKYDVLEEEHALTLAAAIWILDELRLNGRMSEAYQFLPSDLEDLWDIWVPTDFYHPSYDVDLIQSVAHTINMKRSKGSCTEEFKGLISLLDENKVIAAAEKFKKLQWDAIRAWLRTEGYFNRQEEEVLGEIRRMVQGSVLTMHQSNLGDRRSDLLDRYYELEDLRSKINVSFSDYFASGEKKIFGIRQIGKAMEANIDNPFEICFGLFYLYRMDDDTIWLMRAGTAAADAVGRLLPWYGNMYEGGEDDLDGEEWEIDGRPIDWNGWPERGRQPEAVDFYRPSAPGAANIAQEIYKLSRGVVPAGMHPFSLERKQMKEDGKEHADLIADWAEILFLSSYQAKAVNLRHSWTWDGWKKYAGDDEETDAETYADKDIEEDENADEKEMENETEDTDTAQELLETREELRRARRQIKNLRSAMAEMRHSAEDEISKVSNELKTLRMEHRELADLRELVFNRENEVREEASGEISFPYEPKKRTVIFGGHDTFLKALRQMLTTVKYVETEKYGFDPSIVRNADVVWIQTNCISHSQYGNILKLTRQHSIQLRYFAYASAEKCAEQVVEEDQKD